MAVFFTRGCDSNRARVGRLGFVDMMPDEDHHDDLDPDAEAAHEAATLVRNVDKIVFGKYEMEAWYVTALGRVPA
jgi:hypothetical protein